MLVHKNFIDGIGIWPTRFGFATGQPQTIVSPMASINEADKHIVSELDQMAGRILEIADYCKSDVINTYRLWLRHELFRGRLDQNQFEFSERDALRIS